ncbi:MAG: hypothetical protein NVSMB12_10210 [Acidimicrobiales bacterium]
MAYAVSVKVRIVAGRYDDAMKELNDDIVPMVKGAPGLVSGTWFGDKESGNALVVFETQEQAQQMASMVQAGPGGAVEIESAKVYEVHAQA